MTLNEFTDVEVRQPAVAAQEGVLTLHTDGMIGSSLADHTTGADLGERIEDPAVRLWDYLKEPVDFLRMNIEGPSRKCSPTARIGCTRSVK